MAHLDKHLLICTHRRPDGHPRGSCAARGSEQVADALREACHLRGLRRVVRVNATGCLDQCAEGPTVVVYPERVWYGGVRPEDVDGLLKEHLRDGKPVERLRLDEERLNGKGATVAEVWQEPEA